jgi:competence protein ComEC
MTIGAVAAAGAAQLVPSAGPGGLHLLLVVCGLGCFFVAARGGLESHVALWLIAGLLVAGGHGLHVAADRHKLADLVERDDPAWIRTAMVVTEGWTEGRWGWRTRVRVLDAHHSHLDIPSLRRSRLEIRGRVRTTDLPPSGAVVRGLVSIRGSPESPLLVATSPKLIRGADETSLLPELRGRLADRLLAAARTDVDRIRAAELAAALALGRRDILPPDRRNGWRRSGLAHVLAVSGLHVGLVAGTTWLFLSIGGASPRTTRVVLLMVLPTYALLAGASPSAVRAALMGSIYLGARFLGRAILPMAAVLLTALLLLLVDPALIGEVSFQLTVLLTAALVRWAPGLSNALPLPRWLAVLIAVPVIAQLAAAPLVAHHFSTLIPGAAAANLLVPWLLAPVVLASVAAAALAPWFPIATGPLLDLVDLGTGALWFAATPGRLAEVVPSPPPLAVLIALSAAGLAALMPGRAARAGVASYVGAVVAFALWWSFVPPSGAETVELLPVSHGLASRISSGTTHLVMDGGGARREAAELLAPARLHRLNAVIASHGDEDHTAGLITLLQTTRVDTLVVPAWLRTSHEAVPLIRTARRHDVRIVPVARGSAIRLGSTRVEVLWPPAGCRSVSENERSLVARIGLPHGTVLLTADIGRSTERTLVETTDLATTILIVPHHGSRGSASARFLDAVTPRFALVPAGPENLHNHPHPEVLARLDERGIEARMPIRDGRCGARWENGGWVLYPEIDHRDP